MKFYRMSVATGLQNWIVAGHDEAEDIADVYEELTSAAVMRVKHFKYPVPYGALNEENSPRCAWVNELSRRFRAAREGNV